MPITASRMGCLPGSAAACLRDARLRVGEGVGVAFRDPVVARIFDPVSKLDSVRLLEEPGLRPRPSGP